MVVIYTLIHLCFSCNALYSNDTFIHLEIDYISEMSSLRELRLRGTQKINLRTIPSFENLIHLTHLVGSVIIIYIGIHL